MYIIHIQAIYTSNLIRIFTNPPYEDSIDTLEDLSNSDLTIYSSRALQTFYKTDTLFEVELSNRILSKLVMVPNHTNSMEELARFRNCAIVIYEQELLSHKTDALSLMKKIVDNRMTGKRHHQFLVRKESSIWNQEKSPKGKYVVVTPEKNTTALFQVLWSGFLVKSLLLIYDNNSFPNIYTCNPYAYENQCGNYVKEYNFQQCTGNTSLQVQDISKNFNKNNLSMFLHEYRFPHDNVYSVLSLMIQDALNVTISNSMNNMLDDAKSPKLFMSPPFFYGHPSYDLTNPYFTDNNVWLVPVPSRMSPFKALFSVFTIDIWILIIVFMMFSTILWWLVKVFSENNRYLEKFSFVFIEMVSATINASVNVIPQTTALKILVVSYIVYIIHIQTIYTSNLIRIFTNPPYEESIETLEDLSNSDLPIYSADVLQSFYKTDTIYQVELSNKILSKIVMIRNHTNFIEEGARFRNCAFVVYDQQLLSQKTDVLLLMKKIVDNRLTGKRDHQFFIRKGSFLLEVINRIIAIGKESGILDKASEKLRFQVSKIINVNENMEDSDPVVLTMEHWQSQFCTMSKSVVIIIFLMFSKLAVGFNATMDDSHLACVLDTIKQLFKEEETVHFICETCDDLIFSNLKNPYVLININKKRPAYKNLKNVVIQVENETVLQDVATIMETDNTVNKLYVRCLVITNNITDGNVFKTLWKVLVINVILITRQNNLYVIKQANPYDDGNCCGNFTNVINTQNCSTKVILKKIKQLNGCLVSLILYPQQEGRDTTEIINILLKRLSTIINATFVRSYASYYTNVSQEYIAFTIDQPNGRNLHDISSPIHEISIYWIVPTAKPFSPVTTIARVFKAKVWIILIAAFIIIFIVSWLILNSNRDNSYSFEQFWWLLIHMISTKLGTMLNRTLRRRSFQLVTIIYLNYLLTIHVIFNAKLIHIFIVKEYGNQISNLDELIDSNLPVYTFKDIKLRVFTNARTGILNKIQKQVIALEITDFIYTLTNMSIKQNEAAVGFIALLEVFQNLDVKWIKDDFLSDFRSFSLITKKSHFLFPLLQNTLRYLDESGITLRDERLINEQIYKNIASKNPSLDNLNAKKKFTLIFIMLAVGLLTASLVFMFEILYK
ncbi:hypothetical protein RN001_013241 [Aquatica leii]|uniref:Ionotropic glutamate receptor C-terminal domain-containing protein n=1 Tax=Aquatica leii TaxID=1421715 RepID=A0AAN7P257_9COLE|nr:hypothetical protein RN001_013241 [Aquatica leii]